MGRKADTEKEMYYCDECLQRLTQLTDTSRGKTRFIKVCTNIGCKIYTNIRKFEHWRLHIKPKYHGMQKM